MWGQFEGAIHSSSSLTFFFYFIRSPNAHSTVVSRSLRSYILFTHFPFFDRPNYVCWCYCCVFFSLYYIIFYYENKVIRYFQSIWVMGWWFPWHSLPVLIYYNEIVSCFLFTSVHFLLMLCVLFIFVRNLSHSFGTYYRIWILRK